MQYRIAGGDWTSQGGLYLWKTAPGAVEVRLARGQTVGDGCKYPVSLAEYTTEGPDWYSSGRQTLVDKATVYLTAADVAGNDDSGRTWPKLSVKAPDCYGQIDLYGDDVTYDGGTGEGHGPAPYEPDGVVTPYHLIAAWNGGEKPCTPKTPESPTPTPSEPTPSTPATPTETTPPATHKPPTKPPTTPDVPPLESTPPAAPKPTPSDSTPPLAETGSSTPVGPIVGGAALVVAVGAGVMFATRRTRRS